MKMRQVREVSLYLFPIIVFISLILNFVKVLGEAYGVSNLFTIFRDFLLLMTFIIYRPFSSRKQLLMGSFLVAIVIFSGAIIGMVEGRWDHSIYYARLYFLPLIFLLSFNSALRLNDKERCAEILVHSTFVVAALIAISSFVLYILLQVNPSLFLIYYGVESQGDMASAWFISGAAWMRAGLPAASPNALGFFLGSVLILYLVDGRGKEKLKTVVVVFSVLMLALSFSRSAWLALAVSVFFILIWGKGREGELRSAKRKAWAIIALVLISFYPIFVIFDDISDHAISIWIKLNITGTDPSMLGHKDSMVSVLENFDEYFMYGYPKGTVGARSALLGELQHNVENGFFSIFYEMGIFLGVFLIVSYSIVLRSIWVSGAQTPFMIYFILVSIFLPIFFEMEIVLTFFYLFTLASLYRGPVLRY